MKEKILVDSKDSLIAEVLHQQIIASGTDVPEQVPSFAIPLNEVGISGKTVWVHLPEGRLPFEASISVDLPAHIRGIHMSRLEQAISELHEQQFERLSDYLCLLAEKIISRQQGNSGKITLTGKRPLLRQSKISRQLSVDPLHVKHEVLITKGNGRNDILLTTGIGACHITACPCTQVYNHEVFSGHGNCPMPTHSQRSLTWLYLSGQKVPPYMDLLACLDDALHLTQDLLKRPDEAEIVLKSHNSPQFAEDAVRETARAVGLRFAAKLPEVTGVVIESLSLESIHIHDVCCRLETTLGRISHCINTSL